MARGRAPRRRQANERHLGARTGPPSQEGAPAADALSSEGGDRSAPADQGDDADANGARDEGTNELGFFWCQLTANDSTSARIRENGHRCKHRRRKEVRSVRPDGHFQEVGLIQCNTDRSVHYLKDASGKLKLVLATVVDDILATGEKETFDAVIAELAEERKGPPPDQISTIHFYLTHFSYAQY